MGRRPGTLLLTFLLAYLAVTRVLFLYMAQSNPLTPWAGPRAGLLLESCPCSFRPCYMEIKHQPVQGLPSTL